MDQQVGQLAIDQDQVMRSLSEAMMVAVNTSTRTLEEAAEALQVIYKGHLFVNGTFSISQTYRGSELAFVGTVCGNNITHAIWC